MMPKQMVVGIGVALLLVCVAGWFRPLPTEPGKARNSRTAWSLPPAAELERSSAAQFAATAKIKWPGDTTAGSGAEGATSWTLLALVRGPDQAALVRAGSDPLIKRFKAGDTLPDGSRLLEVLQDAVLVERDGCQTRRRLYRSSNQEDAADACGAPQDP